MPLRLREVFFFGTAMESCLWRRRAPHHARAPLPGPDGSGARYGTLPGGSMGATPRGIALSPEHTAVQRFCASAAEERARLGQRGVGRSVAAPLAARHRRVAAAAAAELGCDRLAEVSGLQPLRLRLLVEADDQRRLLSFLADQHDRAAATELRAERIDQR